jgi:hypothetical protein
MNRSSMPKQTAEHSMTVAEEREEAISQLFELVDDMSGVPCICGRANNGTCGCVPATAPAMLTATLRVEERSLRRKALDVVPELLKPRSWISCLQTYPCPATASHPPSRQSRSPLIRQTVCRGRSVFFAICAMFTSCSCLSYGPGGRDTRVATRVAVLRVSPARR